MELHLSKKKLYTEVSEVRKKLHIRAYEPVDIVDVMQYYMGLNHTLFLKLWPFDSRKIGGITIIGDKITTMILNSHRTREERRFDWAHETIHYYLHRDIEIPIFNCIDLNSHQKLNTEDAILEWQANEGAAELLLPYKCFIIKFCEAFRRNMKSDPYFKFRYAGSTAESLAFYYGLSKPVIENRIKSLTCEIYQFLAGIDPDDIKVISRNQQEKAHINIGSIWQYMFNTDCLNAALDKVDKSRRRYDD